MSGSATSLGVDNGAQHGVRQTLCLRVLCCGSGAGAGGMAASVGEPAAAVAAAAADDAEPGAGAELAAAALSADGVAASVW